MPLPRRIAIVIDRWHWLLLAVAAPFLIFPSPERAPLMLVVPLLWTIGWIARPCNPLPSTSLNAALLAMAFMVLVSVLVTPDLAFSLPKVAGMVLAFGAFFAVAREAGHPAGFWMSLLLLLALGLGIAALSLVGTQWGAKISFFAPLIARLAPRITGLVGAEEGFNANQVAGTLLWVAPLFLSLPLGLAMSRQPATIRIGLSIQRAWLRILLAVLVALSMLVVLAVLVLTQSRGAYVAFVLALVTILFLALSRRARWIMVAILIVTVVAGSLYAWPRREALAQQFGLRIDNTAAGVGAGSADSLNTLDGRLEIWSRAIYGIEDFPFTGMGMNSFRRLVNLLYPLFLTSPDTDIAHAHNEFLQAALDLGIPGMIAFGALYVVALWMLRRIWVVSAGDPLNRALVLGLGGGLFAHFIFGMADAVALGAKPGVLFWMLLGLICGLFAQCCANRTRPIDTIPALQPVSVQPGTSHVPISNL